MTSIVKVQVVRMHESCQRTTYLVELTTQEGFSMTPSAFATSSVYTDFVGPTLEEARDRALIEAAEWADFLNLTVQPYSEGGIVIEPSMTLETYTSQRERQANV